ncbi:hypothetical protein NXX78_18830 [Bacteroides fragilis]|nr:hypothetical protein [Bacteroides fragilis]
MLKELSGQVFALVRELPKPLSREEMRELKRLCRFPEQYGEGSGAETGGEKINPGVKKNRETDGESGVRVGVEAFRRDFYGGFNIRKCKKVCCSFASWFIAEDAQWQGFCFVRLAADRD